MTIRRIPCLLAGLFLALACPATYAQGAGGEQFQPIPAL